jgi:pyruvate, water dikinase
MEFIRTFGDINRNDVALAGGKATSLAELARLAMPVPDGFVVLTSAYERFLTEAGLLPHITSIFASLDNGDIRAVQRASEHMRNLISAAKPHFLAVEIGRHYKLLNSEYVAVRSSATTEDSQSASWAGQFETSLNATEATLLDSIIRCYSSAFSRRVISYQLERRLKKRRVSVAVIVQKMVKSDAAGTAFSAHPVSNDQNHAVIEAVFGLGEPMVSGITTPDTYVIDKRTSQIVDIHISEQKSGLFCARNGGTEWLEIDANKRDHQKLANSHILELVFLIMRAEQHFGVPVDVEWAQQDDRLYVLQARPITGFKTNN